MNAGWFTAFVGVHGTLPDHHPEGGARQRSATEHGRAGVHAGFGGGSTELGRAGLHARFVRGRTERGRAGLDARFGRDGTEHGRAGLHAGFGVNSRALSTADHTPAIF